MSSLNTAGQNLPFHYLPFHSGLDTHPGWLYHAGSRKHLMRVGGNPKQSELDKPLRKDRIVPMRHDIPLPARLVVFSHNDLALNRAAIP